MGSIDKACISGFLCRLCSEMHRIVIHIYGDQGQRLCLVEKINGYLPITVIKINSNIIKNFNYYLYKMKISLDLTDRPTAKDNMYDLLATCGTTL